MTMNLLTRESEIARLEAKLEALRAQLAEAREALRPFADKGDKCNGYEENDWEFRIKGKYFARALKVYNKLVTTA